MFHVHLHEEWGLLHGLNYVHAKGSANNRVITCMPEMVYFWAYYKVANPLSSDLCEKGLL